MSIVFSHQIDRFNSEKSQGIYTLFLIISCAEEEIKTEVKKLAEGVVQKKLVLCYEKIALWEKWF